MDRKLSGLAILALVLILATCLIAKSQDKIRLSSEEMTDNVEILPPQEHQVTTLLNEIEALMRQYQSQLMEHADKGTEYKEIFQNYAIPELWDYFAFTYDVYNHIPFPYYEIAIPLKDEECHYLHSGDGIFYYQVKFRILPETKGEFISDGIVGIQLMNDTGTWKIAEISQPYNDMMFCYFPNLLNLIESSNMYFFNHVKMEGELLSKELLDKWVEIADQYGMNGNPEPKAMIEGYLLPDSSKRILTEEEILKLDPLWRYFAVQEIYARHGKKFDDYFLHWYFMLQDWYHPEENVFSSAEMTAIEKGNIEFLMKNMKHYDADGFKEMDSLYPSGGQAYAISGEEAGNIITMIYCEIRNLIEPDMRRPMDEDHPNSPHLLKGAPDKEEMRRQLLRYAREDALETIYSVMEERGVHYSEDHESYFIYLGGEVVTFAIDSIRPFCVLEESEKGYKVEVPLWIGSVFGTGRSRAWVWIEKEPSGEWKVFDIAMDLDKVVERP